jgi:hypothetical protein
MAVPDVVAGSIEWLKPARRFAEHALFLAELFQRVQPD